MRFTLTAAVVAVMMSASTVAQTSVRDGAWWDQQSAMARTSYATGVLEGIRVGLFAILAKMPGKVTDPNANAAIEAYLSFERDYVRTVTGQQLADALTELYNNPQNTGLAVSDTVQVALLKIGGTPASLIEETLRDLRQKKK